MVTTHTDPERGTREHEPPDPLEDTIPPPADLPPEAHAEAAAPDTHRAAITPQAGMLPAHDLEAEAVVLSAALNGPHDERQLCVDAGLVADDFYSPDHSTIWRAVIAAAEPSLVDVARELRAMDRGALVAYAAGLRDDVPSVASVLDHVRDVRDHAGRRRVAHALQLATAEAYSAGDLSATISRLRSSLAAIVDPPRTSLLFGPDLARPLPPISYLVRELGIVDGGGAPHIVAGYGYSGKTAALQSLLLSLAADRPVWGCYRAARRRVVHVDLEQGEQLTIRRYQRMAASMRLHLPALGDAIALEVMPRRPLTPENRDAWMRVLEGRDVCVIDSLRAATGGMDENSSDVRGPLDMLGDMSNATGCRVIMIVHARKPTEANGSTSSRYAVRGSSAIYDSCDCCYVFAGEKGEPVSATQEKARSDGHPVDGWSLVIEDEEIDGEPFAGLTVTCRGAELVDEHRQARVAASQIAQVERDVLAVTKALSTHPGLGTMALRARASLSGARLSAAVEALGDSLVVRTKPRSRARLHYLTGQECSDGRPTPTHHADNADN